MQTKNVYYADKPAKVIITENNGSAVVELPVNVSEVDTEEGKQYLAETVYYVRTKATKNLKSRVTKNYNAWLEVASIIEPQKATLDDAIDAINALTDIVIGGY